MVLKMLLLKGIKIEHNIIGIKKSRTNLLLKKAASVAFPSPCSFNPFPFGDRANGPDRGSCTCGRAREVNGRIVE